MMFSRPRDARPNGSAVSAGQRCIGRFARPAPGIGQLCRVGFSPLKRFVDGSEANNPQGSGSGGL